MSRGLHVPLDVAYYDDEKIIEAGERAEVLFIRGLCFMKHLKSDGFVADNQLIRLHLSGVKARAATLVRVGLSERVEGGYLCTSWLKHNKSKEEIDYDRDQHAAKMRRLRARAQEDDVPGHTDDCADGTGSGVPQPETRQDKTETETDGTAKPHLCPDPFEIDELLRKWGDEHAPLVDLDGLALEMVLWSRSGGKRKSSWRRTLQAWANKRQTELGAKSPRGGDLAW